MLDYQKDAGVIFLNKDFVIFSASEMKRKGKEGNICLTERHNQL
jgi:hypothetical protein